MWTRCDECAFAPQYCRARKVQLVTISDLESETFRYDVRHFLSHLRLNPHTALDRLSALYRDAPCSEVFAGEHWFDFDTSALEFPTFPWWYRDLCRLPPKGTATRLRPERREAFRILATLLRLIFPAETSFWGRRKTDDQPVHIHSALLIRPSLNEANAARWPHIERV